MTAWMPTLAAICSLTILLWRQSSPRRQFAGRRLASLHVRQHGRATLPVAGFIVNLFQRAGVASSRLFEVFDRQPEIA